MGRALTQKMLHGALAELRTSEGEQRHRLADAVSRLFLRQSARDPADPGL
jgi:glutamyl-tRNA reductase